jgi:hypothetical protein
MRRKISSRELVIAYLQEVELANGEPAVETPEKWASKSNAIKQSQENTFITPKLVKRRTSMPSSWTL